MKEEITLKVNHLRKWFPVRSGLIGGLISRQRYVKAVDDICFEVKRGEVVGLVGESGCGKTTTGRVVLRLIEPTSGTVYFNGRDIFSIKGKEELLKFRREMQMIFQDPFGSLDPISTIYDLLSEPLKIHKEVSSKAEREERVMQVLEATDLPVTKEFMLKRPTQLSGGQRQRVAIARSLIIRPKFIVADEPVSMLDASVKGSIINLMQNLREKFGITYMLIIHDFSVAWHLCDRIMVMYLGKIVDSGLIEVVIKNQLHPYTKVLISAAPDIDPSTKAYLDIDRKIYGQVPSSIDPPGGCRFHPRCPHAKEVCSTKEPQTVEIERGHTVACHLYS